MDRFHSIFEHSNDAGFVIDLDKDEIVEANSRACSMLGYTRAELLATPISAIHPHEIPKMLEFARSVMTNGKGWTDELSCMTKAGDTVPAEISASIVELNGRTCIVALVRDIRQRKELEAELEQRAAMLESRVQDRTAALQQAAERERTLLDINNAIITDLDRKSLFRSISKALHGVLSFDAAAIRLYHPERRTTSLFALELPSLEEPICPTGAEIPLDESLTYWVVENKQPMLRQDLQEQSRFVEDPDYVAAGLRSHLAVPLIARETVSGTLMIGSETPGLYSEEDARFLGDVSGQIALAVENVLAYEEISRLKAELERESLYLREEIKTEHNFEEIVGESRAILTVLQAVETVAPTDATVLIQGASGTGKELIARAIHDLSQRKSKPLIKVNCAAIPAGLVESELFGHEKGAFTGALKKKTGRFELADGGTLFLDEIGDLSPDTQASLLRVLQESEFERVGGEETIRTDVRLIAATNRDLEQAIEEARFREDLFYRLNVFPIHLPPLCERQEDIPLLVNYFVLKYCAKLGKKIDSIPRAAMNDLVAYPWPGNIRELQNVVDRAVIMSLGGELNLAGWNPKPEVTTEKQPLTLDEAQRAHILTILEKSGWIVSGPRGAAKILGIKPTTLESRMQKFGIRRPT